jgi:hypothetical protein
VLPAEGGVGADQQYGLAAQAGETFGGAGEFAPEVVGDRGECLRIDVDAAKDLRGKRVGYKAGM